ncbi:precorrin-2 dehydrogenase/sirohydrochlorin ferrochelatase family protein [Lacrimispora sp.]|uniref:precorrin-2 dehydrogenase/sirohydrochlorin ferrochelatase family protein n=1 Tax=Lacrimispora sp. TaxID=2719234 RepID=UPI0028AC1BB3|nr:bifunctional precorrin-2 dehydrogenase/sirohydrochlorin ferrochelatase [Lacrimispora sp.]
MAYFPFFVDLEDKKCLIVGGGTVSYRKVEVLMDYCPQITVVAPKFYPELKRLQKEWRGNLKLEEREFKESDLEDPDFVVAGTSDEALNKHISDLCRARKIPINVVDVQEECSFIFPALIKEKHITVAISTGGHSPTIAKYLKDKFKEAIPDGFGDLAEQLGSYRDLVKEKVDLISIRTDIFKTMVEEGIQQGGVFTREQAEELIERKLAEHER